MRSYSRPTDPKLRASLPKKPIAEKETATEFLRAHGSSVLRHEVLCAFALTAIITATAAIKITLFIV
jgi:hypothetical protein